MVEGGAKRQEQQREGHGGPADQLSAVPATALSAAVCKWSLCQRGYLPPDPWSEALASSWPPQSPLVNRCYYDRCRVVRSLTHHFLSCASSSSEAPPPRVVFLGGGLDSYPLLVAHHFPHATVVVVDLPEVLDERRTRLEQCRGGAAASSWRWSVRCVAADLRDLSGLRQALLSPPEEQEGAGLGSPARGAATLFVLESVLGYLQQHEAQALLRWLAVDFPGPSSVLVLDQLLLDGHDMVGRAVGAAFEARDCPLTGLSDWRGSLVGACGAMRRAGWAGAWALDLGRAVEVVGCGGEVAVREAFDEQAALHAFRRQYVVAVGWGGDEGWLDVRSIAAAARQQQQQQQQGPASLEQQQQEALVTALEARVGALEEDNGEVVEVRRVARGEDEEEERVWGQVRRLFVEGVRSLAEQSPAVQRMAREALLGRELRGAKEGEGRGLQLWVAERAGGGPVLGGVGLEVRGQEAEVKRLSVSSRARRQGLGRRLLSAVEEEARVRGAMRVRAVTVQGMQAAAALYHHLGYRRLQQTEQQEEDHVASLVTFVKPLLVAGGHSV